MQVRNPADEMVKLVLTSEVHQGNHKGLALILIWTVHPTNNLMRGYSSTRPLKVIIMGDVTTSGH